VDPVAILHAGMVTGVGFNAPSTCAAIRCGITGFVETRFMFEGEWLIGCPVPSEENWRGRERLLQMAVPAITECMAGIDRTPPSEIPLLLCVAEDDRPGRLAGLDQTFLHEVQARVGQQFHQQSVLIERGRVGGVEAIDLARRLVANGRPYCILAGVDSLLVGPTLAAYDSKSRIQTAENSNGFIPGEAAAAVLLAPARRIEAELHCSGIGFGTEPASVNSEQPLRADGLVEAIRAAFADSGLGYEQMDFRITDISGEQYGFKEAALAQLRSMRVRKEEFYIWHPADCIGEVGAAIVPVILGVALIAMRKGYAPGPGVLCHCANDDSQRACFVLQYQHERVD
jgi:3-oxoacyl-[acyl-carrier-protein] synthase I